MINITCGVTRIRNAGFTRKGTCGPLVRSKAVSDGRRFLLTCAHIVAPAGFALDTRRCEVLDGDGAWIGVGDVIEFSDADDGVDAAVVQLDRASASMTSVVGDLGLPKGVTQLTGPGMAIRAMCGVTGRRDGLALRGRPDDVELEYIDMKGRTHLFHYAQHLSCARFTQKGDSGSTVLDWDNYFLGMIVGATLGTNGNTVIAPFHRILDFFRTRKNLDLELVV
jgi:hypothetical protein